MKIIQFSTVVRDGELIVAGLGDDNFVYEYEVKHGVWHRWNDEHPFSFNPFTGV